MNLSKRHASDEDYKWLLKLKTASLRDYVDQVYGWEDNTQADYFRNDFCSDSITIITMDGVDVGMYELAEEPSIYFIKRIEIFPTFQKKGIGSNIIKEILLKASKAGKDAWLMLFKINPAHSLYNRLGFKIESETETHYKMVWRRNDSASS